MASAAWAGGRKPSFITSAHGIHLASENLRGGIEQAQRHPLLDKIGFDSLWGFHGDLRVWLAYVAERNALTNSMKATRATHQPRRPSPPTRGRPPHLANNGRNLANVCRSWDVPLYQRSYTTAKHKVYPDGQRPLGEGL